MEDGESNRVAQPYSNNTTFVKRTLNLLSSQRSPPGLILPESAKEIKGGLGLNLLYSPSTPSIDFIFVHGLGGGSRKTWSKSSSPDHYWPKEWLRKEPEFKNVRIHSFGYNADWNERKGSVLGVNDFAKSLIGEINNNLAIRGVQTRIVLVGHSMGGIIMKKAYILARKDAAFEELADRFHTMYFLATPHRGSNMARPLANILKITYGQKPYVKELENDSSATTAINNDFRDYAQDLRLWSFYETLETGTAAFNTMVVEKHSATLGYPHERVALLNGDHRGICKFDTPTDSNYRTLRNAFASTVDSITSEVVEKREQASREDLRRISVLTGVSSIPRHDLEALEDARVEGSGQWFGSEDDFQAWALPSSNSAPIYWLHGNPGSGKSILASSIINYLETRKLRCCYFFFKHGTATQSSLAECLLSIAYQMARHDDRVRKSMLSSESENLVFTKESGRTIWRRLFLNNILRADSSETSYWVIDGLDECNDRHFIFTMLSQVKSCKIKVLITSRNIPEIQAGLSQLGDLAIVRTVQTVDTAEDMRAFIVSRLDQLPIHSSEGGEDSQTLVSRILEKSAGSFLWTRLVIQELEQTWSEEGINEVLSEIPADMDELYTRTLENMSKMRRGLKLAKAILTWTACAVLPLTIHELKYALKLDTKETVHDLRRTIESICGQLVFVDHQSRVQMVHQTARDFLLQENLDSCFAIRPTEAHTRIAQICLDFLSSDTFKNKPRRGDGPEMGAVIPFTDYACVFFSDHMRNSSFPNPELIGFLLSFMKSNILLWIEYLAATGSVQRIIHTAMNVKSYISNISDRVSKDVESLKIIEAWVVDLTRVASKFGAQLVMSPSSIHSVIPPMCPSDSIIHRTYASKRRGLAIEGTNPGSWDDCFARIDYVGPRASTIDHGETAFAVGLSNGHIFVYHKNSLQIISDLEHGEQGVKLLKFGKHDKILASSGLKYIKIWDIDRGIHLFTIASAQALALNFTGEGTHLVAALRSGDIVSWRVEDGFETTRNLWSNGPTQDAKEEAWNQTASVAAFSQDHTYIAITGRTRPVQVFNLKAETFWGDCTEESSKLKMIRHDTVMAMLFNRNPDRNQLFVSYHGGNLVFYDIWTLELRNCISDVNAISLSCSPDGRTLATGNSFGTIRIYDLSATEAKTPTLLYNIDAESEGIKGLCFSSDGHRFLDIRRSQCRVWEPPMLVCRDERDGCNQPADDPFSVVTMKTDTKKDDFESQITAMLCHPDGDHVICGKRNGSISIWGTQDGEEQSVLYNHKTDILFIEWGEATNLLVTVDVAASVMINTVDTSTPQWSVVNTLVQKHFSEAITSILLNESNSRLLICGRETLELWSIIGTAITTINARPFGGQTTCAIGLPDSPANFAVFSGNEVRIYSWQNFTEVGNTEGIPLDRAIPTSPGGCFLKFEYRGHRKILAELLTTSPSRMPPKLTCWEFSELQPQSNSLEYLPGFDILGPYIQHIISIDETRLIYLDIDLWVCSIEFKTFPSTQQAKRHFFIPADWRSTTGDMLFRMTSKGEFVFVKRNFLVVIKRGLDISKTFTVKRRDMRGI